MPLFKSAMCYLVSFCYLIAYNYEIQHCPLSAKAKTNSYFKAPHDQTVNVNSMKKTETILA